ncbi:MAG: glycosyltransferase family 2 protein [Rikenellaceae bacterium]
MRVAVVILNYNGEGHLRRFLPSVVEHTPSFVDIIVADNGSSDSSCSLIRDHFSPRVELLALDQNYGFAAGYNRALERLDHEIFLLLNSDVEVSANYIEPLLEELLSSDDIAAVGPKLRSVVEPNKFEYAGAAGGYIDFLGYPFCRGRIMNKTEVDHGQYDDSRDLFWVSGAAFCCRSSIYKSLGGFDGDFFAHMEEIDLCWRMQLAGYRIRIVPQSVVYHLGGGTLSTLSPFKTELNHRNNLAMLYKCAPTRQRITVAVVRPFLDLAAALSYLCQGQVGAFNAVFKAWWGFLRWHKALNKKRRAIRSNVVAESKHIYNGSIFLK